jgi:8-oxo-dGTP diphosphatase
MRRIIYVVAAVMINEQGQILLTERPAGKSLAGLWEFPGGKIEPGEQPMRCLIRELAEEIGVTVDSADIMPLTFVEYDYPDFTLFMPLYVVRRWAGEVQSLEQQRFEWIDLNRLGEYPVPPADEAVIQLLPKFLAAL